MDKETKKIVQVVFNHNDPDQRKQYEFVLKRNNMSGYLKRLIQRDMDFLTFETRDISTFTNRVEEPELERVDYQSFEPTQIEECVEENEVSFMGFI
jgi:hypothetical protein